MLKEARYYKKLKDGRVQCQLCPHVCMLNNQETGKCHVRKCETGKLLTGSYGAVSGYAADPVEKKPLYHFLPGTDILSVGSIGCNMTCLYCQNNQISQCSFDQTQQLRKMLPREIIREAIEQSIPSIAYTYNEPVISIEYIEDTARLAHQNGLRNVMVSNGYILEKPIMAVVPLIDAVNIDLKAFSQDIYQKVCGADLRHVLNTLEIFHRMGIHTEITFLAVEGLNDDMEQFDKMIDHIHHAFGSDQVLHISRYFPRHKMTNAPTSLNTISRMMDTASGRLRFVYAGNTGPELNSDTVCPMCNNVIIKREHYRTKIMGLNENCCSFCNHKIPGIYE